MVSTISIIIPTHNRSDMLKRAIQSVLKQTFQEFELIVVSDGSDDNTEEVVASFSDSRIRFLKHEVSRGASAARNIGVNASSGKYIAFLDDDDIWFPQKLDAQLEIMESSNPRVGLVYCWIEYVEGNTLVNERRPTLKGDILAEMLDKQAITNSSSLLIKREVFDRVEGFDESLAGPDDGDFIRRVARWYEADYVPEVLVRIHVGHHDRLSIFSKRLLEHSVRAYEKWFRIFDKQYAQYPQKKANALNNVASYCILAGEYRKAFSYSAEMLTIPCGFPHKMTLLFAVCKTGLKSLYFKVKPKT